MTTMTIPQFHFPNGKSTIKHDQDILKTITTVKHIYNYRPFLSESQFVPVSEACGLPRYLNMAFFRKLESIGKMDMRVTFSAFIKGWTSMARNKSSDDDDECLLFFNILKKPNNTNWISPEDFLPVLEDVVLNHPGLKFLGDNPMFQERYIETVICRIYYEGKCATGRMNLSHFKKCNFTQMIKNLGPNVDLNNTRDCFSYKHFYVLYCKFWILDEDHDLIISENDLLNYNDGILSPRLTKQIMINGRIPAFAREQQQQNTTTTLTYLDYIWLLLSETDKSTPVAIEYWFRCMDEDGDGIITTYDLAEYWEKQDKKLQDIIESYSDECIRFDDLICQMNDLIQPKVPGQFRLSDLKRNGIIAERFFDTFLNIEKFQIHDTYQGLIRSIQQLEKEKTKRIYELEKKKRIIELQQNLFVVADNNNSSSDDNDVVDESEQVEDNIGEEEEQQQQQRYQQQPFSLGVWCEYAEKEYELLIISEQCASVDSDWSVRNNEPEEEDEVTTTTTTTIEEYTVPPENETHHSELTINTNTISITMATEEENISKIIISQEEEEDEIESPIMQESSDDHESDSSAPSTPVMQDPIDCNNKKWLKDDNNSRKVLDDNNKSNWIWHSVQ